MTLRIRSDNLVWQIVDGDVVALDLEASSYFRVNGSGTLLWSSLTEGTTRDELVATLAEAYGMPQQRAGGDVDAFLATLAESGLLAR